MSREQWGHGYYAGYEACKNEEKRIGVKKPTDYDIILSTCYSISYGKTYVGLNLLLAILVPQFFGTEKEAIKKIKKCRENGHYDLRLGFDANDEEVVLFAFADGKTATEKIIKYQEELRGTLEGIK